MDSVADLLRYGEETLKSVDIAGPDLEVNLLLGHCLGKSRTQLLLAANETVIIPEKQLFLDLLDRRKSREPLAYILGEWEFWSLPFVVNPHVLIPRPETEYLLESVLEKKNPIFGQTSKVLDLCCGSGVIAVVLARELSCCVTAVDISADALVVARENARRHGAGQQVNYIQADLFCAFSARCQFALIVTNPPYVARNELYHTVQPEIVTYEPHLALDGGLRGFSCIEKIIQVLPGMLLPGGDFFMEIGADQALEIKKLIIASDPDERLYDNIEILQDYAKKDRVVHLRRKTL